LHSNFKTTPAGGTIGTKNKNKTDDGRSLLPAGHPLVFSIFGVPVLEFLNALLLIRYNASHNLSASLAYRVLQVHNVSDRAIRQTLISGDLKLLSLDPFFIQKYEFVGTLNQDLSLSAPVSSIRMSSTIQVLDNKWKRSHGSTSRELVLGLILVVALFVSTLRTIHLTCWNRWTGFCFDLLLV
jgi:hypothetical protein